MNEEHPISIGDEEVMLRTAVNFWEASQNAYLNEEELQQIALDNNLGAAFASVFAAQYRRQPT